MIEVKFGTVRPVSFREFDESYKYTDLIVYARMAGVVFVSDYDRELYRDDDAVSAFIKSNATDIMQKSLDALPAGKSVVKSDKSGVADQFAAELSKSGITARAEIKLFSLLPESEEKLGNLFKLELMAEKSTIKPYGIIPGEAGEWLCVYCGTANNCDQFCMNCGRPSHLEWQCPSCMFMNKGGNKCSSCGRPRLPYDFLG